MQKVQLPETGFSFRLQNPKLNKHNQHGVQKIFNLCQLKVQYPFISNRSKKQSESPCRHSSVSITQVTGQTFSFLSRQSENCSCSQFVFSDIRLFASPTLLCLTLTAQCCSAHFCVVLLKKMAFAAKQHENTISAGNTHTVQTEVSVSEQRAACQTPLGGHREFVVHFVFLLLLFHTVFLLCVSRI